MASIAQQQQQQHGQQQNGATGGSQQDLQNQMMISHSLPEGLFGQQHQNFPKHFHLQQTLSPTTESTSNSAAIAIPQQQQHQRHQPPQAQAVTARSQQLEQQQVRHQSFHPGSGFPIQASNSRCSPRIRSFVNQV